MAEDSGPMREALLGRGYLVSDYPCTQTVLRTLEPLALSLEDDCVDPGEAAILDELGRTSLLMLPFVSGGGLWGLAEVYGDGGRRFDAGDAGRASEILRAAGAALERV